MGCPATGDDVTLKRVAGAAVVAEAADNDEKIIMVIAFVGLGEHSIDAVG